MRKSDELRKNAQSCAEMAVVAEKEPSKKRYERMAEAWRSLADTQAWLDGDSPTNRDGDIPQRSGPT